VVKALAYANILVHRCDGIVVSKDLWAFVFQQVREIVLQCVDAVGSVGSVRSSIRGEIMKSVDPVNGWVWMRCTLCVFNLMGAWAASVEGAGGATADVDFWAGAFPGEPATGGKNYAWLRSEGAMAGGRVPEVDVVDMMNEGKSYVHNAVVEGSVLRSLLTEPMKEWRARRVVVTVNGSLIAGMALDIALSHLMSRLAEVDVLVNGRYSQILAVQVNPGGELAGAPGGPDVAAPAPPLRSDCADARAAPARETLASAPPVVCTIDATAAVEIAAGLLACILHDAHATWVELLAVPPLAGKHRLKHPFWDIAAKRVQHPFAELPVFQTGENDTGDQIVPCNLLDVTDMHRRNWCCALLARATLMKVCPDGTVPQVVVDELFSRRVQTCGGDAAVGARGTLSEQISPRLVNPLVGLGVIEEVPPADASASQPQQSAPEDDAADGEHTMRDDDEFEADESMAAAGKGERVTYKLCAAFLSEGEASLTSRVDHRARAMFGALKAATRRVNSALPGSSEVIPKEKGLTYRVTRRLVRRDARTGE